MTKLKNSVIAFGFVLACAGLAFASYPPLDGLVTPPQIVSSTITGKAFRSVAGRFGVAASSATAGTHTIVLDGTTGIWTNKSLIASTSTVIGSMTVTGKGQFGDTLTVSYSTTDYINTLGANSHILLNNPSATGQTSIGFLTNNSLVGKIRADYAGDLSYYAANGIHAFYTINDADVTKDRLHIKNSGEIGIGTTTPSSLLSVMGGVLAYDYTIGRTTSNPVIAYVGDSITAGVYGVQPYPYYLSIPQYHGLNFNAYNIGVPGRTIKDMSLLAHTNLNPLYAKESGLNIAVVWGGTNDIGSDGVTPEQTFSYLQQFGKHLQQLGWRVIVLTMIDRTDCDVTHNAYNALIRANWPTFSDALADVAANANLGADGASANATYFNDGIHLTDAGNVLVAGIVQPVINSLINNPPINAFPFTGNVGIATSTPVALFTIQQTSGSTIPAFQVSSTTSNMLAVLSNGKTGIGTLTPTGRLEINYSNTDYTNTNGANSHISLNNTSATGHDSLSFLINGYQVGKIRADYAGDMIYVSSSGIHAFYTNGDAGVGTEKVRITNNGSISTSGQITSSGTGTNYLAGNLKLGPAFIIAENTADGTDNSYVQLAGGGTTLASRGGVISIFGNEALPDYRLQGQIRIDAGNVVGASVTIRTGDNIDVLTATYGGNVGIGTATPASKLEVNGDVKASGFTATGYSYNVATSSTIVTATDTCAKGDHHYDADYIYVCTAANTWKRAALTSWP